MKKIRIIAPAKAIDKEYIFYAQTFLQDKGFEVETSKHCLGEYHYFSGTDKERLFDFQQAVDDESVDYILCARGGYGCVRIIDGINFSNFKKNPKLIFGFSDITVIHNHINAFINYPTVHSTVPLNFKENSEESLSSLIKVLNRQSIKYVFKTHPKNVLGKVTAPVVGGNLSVLHSLIGTNSDTNFDGKILFIEDLSESIYAIDRMMWSFKKANKFKYIVGLIVGGFTDIGDTRPPFGKTIEEVVLENTKNLNIPVCFNFPAGHINDNRAIILGKEASLNINVNEVIFEQSSVELTL